MLQNSQSAIPEFLRIQAMEQIKLPSRRLLTRGASHCLWHDSILGPVPSKNYREHIKNSD